MVPKDDYQKYLQWKSMNQAQSFSTTTVSTACISHSTTNQSPWILDSGASDHITSNKSMFSTMSPLKSPHLITLADGSRIAPKGIGQVSLSPSLHLNSVLFIPNCPFNLISLSQLTKSLNCSVTFNAESFVIQERGTGQKIGAGHKSSGLYYFETQPLVSCVAVLSPKLLHDRLGHPSLSKLKLLVPNLKNLELIK
uniref:Retrovirus-related Pol polyprotein from transposon TNT 1-94-like beta-barrel domain-containing protein n=1 Tax=Cajanus cajan TaxID=3821 RepID=A0A151S2I6_CAJCA|nr:hypothetical protein KK1_029238 [Cajanus cajan]